MCDVWGVGGGGGSAPPYGALWLRCRALRPTHSAGRPTEGPRPTPWSRILDQQIRQRGACVVSHSQRVLHILNGPTLLHAAASCCVDSTYHQVRSSPACLLRPDRCTRILRRVAPDQLALHLHLVPARVRCRLLHAPSHLLALPPSQRPGDDAVVLQVHHPDARPRLRWIQGGSSGHTASLPFLLQRCVRPLRPVFQLAASRAAT